MPYAGARMDGFMLLGATLLMDALYQHPKRARVMRLLLEF